MILWMCITVFVTQFLFIFMRTWNVAAVAKENIPQVLFTGGIVHLLWLVSVAIGAFSTTEILVNFQVKYLPVILCSLAGGILGSYYGMKITIKNGTSSQGDG